MKRMIGIISVACCLTNLLVAQQTAETYFHTAAQQFIQGEQTGANELLAEGLASYPDDPELLALKALMEQPPSQQQSSQEQDEENGDNQDQQDQAESSQDPSDQQEQQQNQGQEDNQDPADGGNAQNQPNQAQDPETMSKQNVDHLLDALQQHEGQVQERVRAKQRPRAKPPAGKDW